MISILDIPRRDFTSLKAVPTETLKLMQEELIPEVRECFDKDGAAKRNGLAEVQAHLRARNEVAKTLRSGNPKAPHEGGEAGGIREGSREVQGMGQDISGDGV